MNRSHFLNCSEGKIEVDGADALVPIASIAFKMMNPVVLESNSSRAALVSSIAAKATGTPGHNSARQRSTPTFVTLGCSAKRPCGTLGNQRTTPVITGRLTRVTADITRDQQQNSALPTPPYYTVRIALPAEELARLHDIHLIPGMPVESFIQTHERRPLQYLLNPLQEQIARTFRER